MYICICRCVVVHVYGYECSFVYTNVNIETQLNMGHCHKLLSSLFIDRRSIVERRALGSAHLNRQLAPGIPCLCLPNLGTTGGPPQMSSLVDGHGNLNPSSHDCKQGFYPLNPLPTS